jgi:hypothetical protein
MTPPCGVPSSVGVNPLPASNTPAVSQPAIMSLAGNDPSWPSRKEWLILSNAALRSASRIHALVDLPFRVRKSDPPASWQERPGRNPYDLGSNRASHSGSSAFLTRA